MREKTSSCNTGLISFYVLSISLRHLSRQEEREPGREGETAKEETSQGERKVVGRWGDAEQ